jgi:hypothetical protein
MLSAEVSPLCDGSFAGRGAGGELVGGVLSCGDAGYPGAAERDDHVFDGDVALAAVPRCLLAAGVDVVAELAGVVIAGADKSSVQVAALIIDLRPRPLIAPLSSRGQRRAAS